ncbi:YeeE/YedE family protein [Chitinophagales bacterium]|nr:YeeE/YedE family protein [Chitinophagales bacterium]
MKYLRFLLIGILFGIVMTKSEAISWFRIQEMFRFQAFHMYGIIASALGLGIVFVQLIKRSRLKTVSGEEIAIKDKDFSIPRYLIGGIIFGLGWALTGACPGPMYTLLGNGVSAILVVIAGTLLGTFSYGLVREKLPH